MTKLALFRVILGVLALQSGVAFGYDGSKLTKAAGYVYEQIVSCQGDAIDMSIEEAKNNAKLEAEKKCIPDTVVHRGHIWLLNVQCRQESTYSLAYIEVTAETYFYCELR